MDDIKYTATLSEVARRPNDKFEVFISYSSNDTAVAMTLSQILSDNGIKHWYAPQYLRDKGRRYYIHEIQQGIEHCNTFLLLFSRNALMSDWVSQEAMYAMECKKSILILHIDDTPIANAPHGFGLIQAGRQQFRLIYDNPSEAFTSIIRSIDPNIRPKLPEPDRLRLMLSAMREPEKTYNGFLEKYRYNLHFRHKTRRRIRRIGLAVIAVLLIIPCFITRNTHIYKADGSEYEGSVNLYNHKHGYGILKLGKSTYEGGFFLGQEHGYGKYTLHTDSIDIVTEGHFWGGYLNGKGSKMNLDGSKYVGNFIAGKPWGTGRYYASDGSLLYEGEVRMNMIHGDGIYRNKGKYYKGHFKHGKQDGYGESIDSAWWNGSLLLSCIIRYKGEWKEGIKHGTGTQTIAYFNSPTDGFHDDQAVELSGRWEHGEMVKGTIIYNDSSRYHRFEGVVNGYGTMYYSNGDVYSGYFKHDCYRDSIGTMQYADSSRFEGVWKMDRKYYGIMSRPNGEVYKGYFDRHWNGERKDSLGTLRYGDGRALDGMWSHDLFLHGTYTSTDMNITVEKYRSCWSSESTYFYEGHIDYRDGRKYDGVFSVTLTPDKKWNEIKRHGSGNLTLANGDILYDGQWMYDSLATSWTRNNKEKGITLQIARSNGDSITYWRLSLSRRKGYCNYKFADGSMYCGDMTEELKFEDSDGHITYADGSCYNGGWKDGVRYGEGTYHAASNGRDYKGTWTGDNGYGEILFPDREKYIGEWIGLKRNGKGTQYNRYGEIIYSGIWIDDRQATQ